MPCALQAPQLVIQIIYLEAMGGYEEGDSIVQFSLALSAICLVLAAFDVFGTTLWVCCCRDTERSGSHNM